jgi:hypothetical protein
MRAIPREVNDQVVRNADEAYALGLWCADAYWWSSSIGLSNVEPELILWFGKYLGTLLPPERLRLRVYEVPGDPPDQKVLKLTDKVAMKPSYKMRRTAYHVYVNSRPLLRSFIAARERLSEIEDCFVGPYLAGRFDGDGVAGITPRIAYTTRGEAELDAAIFRRVGIATSVLVYEKANEVCVYFRRQHLDLVKSLIRRYSWKASRLTP